MKNLKAFRTIFIAMIGSAVTSILVRITEEISGESLNIIYFMLAFFWIGWAIFDILINDKK